MSRSDFDCNFRDVSTSDWFYDYVAQATSYGWISGADRSFRPNECITRAEVSVIVNNMLGRAADEDYIDRHEDELNTFPDVKPSPLGVLLHHGDGQQPRLHQEQRK